MKNPLEHQNGKGSKPRPVKGDIYRSRFDEIFGKGKKEEKPKEVTETPKKKQEKELCPHCATMNFVQESPWVSKCLKCGWTRL